MAAAHSGIRWDRIGRIALLFVLAFVLYLYIGPTRSWIATYKEAGKRRAEVAQLKTTNQHLKARRDELRRPATLEREARRLGMVKGGEKSFVVTIPPTHPGG
jgi:cell division protein FtsB